ncbi:GNAT family N-acetyltransferase [Streptomyces sp. NPDC050504]|uniref:GNAT family N-acetyltransferase n=1 Tax=Streptomyces sp. NPDC050504 TaxID=3365618 RepID=UPI00379DD3BF
MIRTATADDLDAIAALHTAARATYYRGHIPEDAYAGPAELARTRDGWQRAVEGGHVLCAERDGEVVGVAAHREVGGVMTLTQLHVRPDRWSGGIGGALHGACVARWRAAGVSAVRLEVYEHNVRAQEFYARHGWRPDPAEPRVGHHLALWLVLGPASGR